MKNERNERTTISCNQENYHGQQQHFNLTNGFFIMEVLSTLLQHVQIAIVMDVF